MPRRQRWGQLHPGDAGEQLVVGPDYLLALVTSAAVGAALLACADLAARRVLAPTELPVGVLTTVLGAPLLVCLLAIANRIGRTG